MHIQIMVFDILYFTGLNMKLHATLIEEYIDMLCYNSMSV